MIRRPIAGVVNQAITDYKEARYCIDAITKAGIYRSEKIGVVTRNLRYSPNSRECYLALAGQVVLYIHQGREVVLFDPNSKEQIKRKLRDRSKASNLELTTVIGTISRKWIREISD